MARTIGPLANPVRGDILIKHLARRVALRAGIRVADAHRMCELVFGRMFEVLATGEDIEIPGLGIFFVRTTKGYWRNQRGVKYGPGPPSTGQRIWIRPRKKVWFRASSNLRQNVEPPDEPF